MKLETTEISGVTYAVVQDGKPVYTKDTGEKIAFDVVQTVGNISRLNGEAKGHRERAEAAEGKLRSFEGITDAAAALKAIETVKSLDGKKLMEAGEFDKALAERVKGYDAKLAEKDTSIAQLQKQFHDEKIGGAFSRSKFIAEKMDIPADMVQSYFGQNFKLENGNIVAYGSDGNPIYSDASPANHASFDEALTKMVNSYAFKDNILKGRGQTGAGTQTSAGGQNGAKVMTMAQFATLSPADKISTAKTHQIVD
jgi:hypothetical protein